ncbi:MAG: aldo/keto reductase [Pyrinomonadaceae bacterium]|nr:aldo/keto reductase [Pyrinomonadaceae bacterium]MCX7640769.1 aldo/keto reductase [Pyrinomonadaceae bacterium]MDW8304664.1 aldo/keto reductase [Acidobacteriota bacterium]
MERRKLGKTELEVSVLGFGGAEIGFNPQQTQSEVNLLLNSAIDAGLNVIDTAAAYMKSEKMIGEAIQHRRKELVLMTKCGALDGFTKTDWSKKGVQETITQSLRNLKTDYIDVVYLHSCSEEILRRADCIEGLIRAMEKGYTRFVGYSGDNEAATYAIELDFFHCLQISVSIADQAAIDNQIPLATAKQMGIVAKRPLANTVWKYAQKPEDSYLHEYWERLKLLKYDFLEKPLSESISIALRFTMTVPGVATMIVGTTKPYRWQENAKYISEGPLYEEQYEKIRNRWKEIAINKNWKGMI